MPGCYEYYDKQFYELTIPNAGVEELYSGCLWAEGPVWFNDYGFLLFSDIPNNRMLRWSPSGGVEIFRADSGFANGNTRDKRGRLITCEHGLRRVTRTEVDGSIVVLADQFDNKKLNSPNDVVIKSDGSVWFTDPDYGIMSDYEGFKAEMEQDGCNVFSCNPATGKINLVTRSLVKPNGLAFSPDETLLYVADSGLSHDPEGPHNIRVFDVTSDNNLVNERMFYEINPGVPDGIRVDSDGNVWSSCGDGVLCISSAGKLIGKIRIPQTVSNLTFGGPRKNRLFITASKSLYSVFVAAVGCQYP
jgi:gluconolactonase